MYKFVAQKVIVIKPDNLNIKNKKQDVILLIPKKLTTVPLIIKTPIIYRIVPKANNNEIFRISGAFNPI